MVIGKQTGSIYAIGVCGVNKLTILDFIRPRPRVEAGE